jgi:hypothetical protein
LLACYTHYSLAKSDEQVSKFWFKTFKPFKQFKPPPLSSPAIAGEERGGGETIETFGTAGTAKFANLIDREWRDLLIGETLCMT